MSFNDVFFLSLYEQEDGQKSDDLTFYLNAASASGSPILDCGCGTGRIMLPLIEAGYEVVGFDYSEPSLVRLQARTGVHPAVTIQKRLEDIKVNELLAFHGPFKLILCAFNTFMHLLTQQAQLQFLVKLHALLAPDGRVIIDIVNPASHDMFSISESEREFEHTLFIENSEESVTTWRTIKNDLLAQTGALLRDHEIRSVMDGKIRTKHSEITYRWVYPTEMALLLRLAGFTDVANYGDYAYGPLTEESENQVWIAMK